MEGTGMNYRQSQGQVAKMMIRCRNKRVVEERERMRKLFEDFQNHRPKQKVGEQSAKKQRSGRKDNTPTHRSEEKKSAPVEGLARGTTQSKHSEGERNASVERPEGKSTPTHRSEGDRSAPVEESIRDEAQSKQSGGEWGEVEQQTKEGAGMDEEDDSHWLTSFVGDEPPLFQSSTVEERPEPKATKSARRSILSSLQGRPEDETVPIEAFKMVAKTTQIGVPRHLPLTGTND